MVEYRRRRFRRKGLTGEWKGSDVSRGLTLDSEVRIRQQKKTRVEEEQERE
jgi:hypothetical protein